MKRKFTIRLITTLFVLQNLFANATALTVQQQLENLNKYWKNKNLDYSILQQSIPLNDEVSLIQMHLWLVEKALRIKNVDYLSSSQKQNREKCLTILHNYRLNGVFPKNLYHSKRTPYFIDKFGTACAVGQLIISTGYGDFANKVKNENNNAYISELNSIYPTIQVWADKFGFEINELAWIQPCYCSMTGSGVLNVTCHGGWNGYFVPDVTGLPAPVSYDAWFKWDGTSWINTWSMCGGCDLTAGNWKCSVIDYLGSSHDFFATITEPPLISPSTSHTNDNGTCNGSSIISATGGIPGYNYSWLPGGFNNDTVTNLCHNTYTVYITDNSGCIVSTTVNIALQTGVEDLSKPSVLIFPNPVFQNLNLQLNDFFLSGKTFASVYNALGKQIIYEQLESAEATVNIVQLPNGFYYLRIDNGRQIVNHSFVKK